MRRLTPSGPGWAAVLLLSGAACLGLRPTARGAAPNPEVSSLSLAGESTEQLLRELPAAPANRRFALLLNLARRLRTRDPGQALEYANRAREAAHTAEYILQAQSEVASITADLGRYAQAITIARNGLAEARGQRRGDVEVEFLVTIGDAERRFSNFSGALATLGEAQAAAEGLGGRLHLSLVNLAFGDLYLDLDQPEQALKRYLSALALAKLADTGDTVASALLRLGGCYVELGDYEQARQAVEQAGRLYDQAGDAEGQSEVQFQLGIVDCRREDYARSAAELEGSLLGYRKLGNRSRQADAERVLGKLQAKQGRTGEALDSFRASVELAQSVGNHGLAAEAYRGLSQVREQRGEFQDALEAERKVEDETAAARNVEERQRVAELDAHFEAERREREIRQLEEETALRESDLVREHREVWALTAALGLAALLIGSVAFRLRRRAKAA